MPKFTSARRIRYKKTLLSRIPPDVTPDAVNWIDQVGCGELFTNTQTITGIAIPITLQLSVWPYGDAAFTLYYSKNGGAYQQIANGSIPFISPPYGGTNVSMSNGDTLRFKAAGGGSDGAGEYVHVVNLSDNNTELDVILFTVQGCL